MTNGSSTIIFALPGNETLAASLALGFAVGYAGEPAQSSDADYASMLTVSGAGAGSIFFSAMNDPER